MDARSATGVRDLQYPIENSSDLPQRRRLVEEGVEAPGRASATISADLPTLALRFGRFQRRDGEWE